MRIPIFPSLLFITESIWLENLLGHILPIVVKHQGENPYSSL